MPDYNNYLKYKRVHLKNINTTDKLLNSDLPNTQSNNINTPNELLNGYMVNTQSNNGNIDGLTLQCFWISILDYLHALCNENKNITIIELKEYGGLNNSTHNKMFDGHSISDNDTIYIKNEYNDGARKIADVFNLTINVYTVNQQKIIITKCSTYGNGENIVNIAYFDLHFELITKYFSP